VTESVFDVVSKNIEKPHIHDDMKEPSVEKHRGEKREILLEGCIVSRECWIGVAEGYDPVKVKSLF
jgi:hypothetical protein